MKIKIHKEFDGKYFVAQCLNLPGCYAQAQTEPELMERLQHGFKVYKASCDRRNQELPNEKDRPVLNIRIRFSEISTDQLIKIFRRYNYHLEYEDSYSALLLNSEFPFNRVHIPKFKSLSPYLIQWIFGKENVVYVPKSNLKLNKSVS